MDMSDGVWRKAMRSTAEGDNCVEVAGAPNIVALRDSKNPNGPRLLMSRNDFLHFMETLKKL
jgi:hypothetical protein